MGQRALFLGGSMQTSDKGIAFLESFEGVVTRAYRDAAGVWTIGAGLTKASGVVRPKAGMQITRAQARELLQKALTQNYEPAVRKAMPGADQAAFDGGVSFHYNTGAIGRASWVTRWRAGDQRGTRAALALWNKAGGKVLKGLVRRREAEADLILRGDYGAAASSSTDTISAFARFVPERGRDDREATRMALHELGYKTGARKGRVLLEAVRHFQEDHGLVVDGLIGKATLATLQRAEDGRKKLPLASGITAITAAPVALSETFQLTDLPLWLVVAIPAAWLALVAFRYRDIIAARISPLAPRIATWLRSF